MHLQLRDSETREIIKVFSNIISLIWTERFRDLGDCELVMPLTKENVNLFIEDRYLKLYDSDTLMIIDNIAIDTDNEELTIIGHSFEAVLYRRIWHEWNNETNKAPAHNIKDCFSTVMKKVFIDSIGNSKGKVDYVLYSVENNDVPSDDIFTTPKNHYPQRGDGIGEYLYSLALVYNFGIRSEFNQEDKTITFFIYDGQTKTNIVFSKARYNFKNSRLVKSTQELKTTAMVAGEGEGTERKIVTVAKSINRYTPEGELIDSNVEYLGIKQREMFVDARDIQKQSGESNNSYIERLRQRGRDNLFVNNFTQSIDGKVLNVGPYKLNVDYKLGDIVTVKDDFFHATVKIVEVIRSWDQNGYEIYPSFETLSLINSTEIIETNIT